MQHLLGKRAPVVELDQEIFQEAGGKVSEGSGVTQVVGLLVLQLQQVVHLRPLTDAVANSLVVRGDCGQTGASQTTNCHLSLVKLFSPSSTTPSIPEGRTGIPVVVDCLPC